MDLIRQDSPTARLLAAALDGEDFTLADVGCSGGIDSAWRLFGDRLSAFAFDPGVDEIQRLSTLERHSGVHYVAGFVGLPDGHPFKDKVAEPWLLDPWARLSASRTRELHQAAAAAAAAETDRPSQQDLMERSLWDTPELEKASQTIVLPDFLDQAGVDRLDFLKIDVDSVDFEILRSMQDALSRKHVLGAMLEVSFHGGSGEHFNTFHNTDRFMRAQGFELFALTTRPYSLAALPRPFQFRHPFGAQTTQGRCYQGDALYLRDYGLTDKSRDLSHFSNDQLLKLGALYALFGLLDHTAGLLLHFADRLRPQLDIEAALDLMAQEIQDSEPDLWADRRFATYAEYVGAYEADDPAFYAANDRRHDRSMRVHEELAQARRDLAEAREQLNTLQAAHQLDPPAAPASLFSTLRERLSRKA